MLLAADPGVARIIHVLDGLHNAPRAHLGDPLCRHSHKSITASVSLLKDIWDRQGFARTNLLSELPKLANPSGVSGGVSVDVSGAASVAAP
jgi:hypothetical protein